MINDFLLFKIAMFHCKTLRCVTLFLTCKCKSWLFNRLQVELIHTRKCFGILLTATPLTNRCCFQICFFYPEAGLCGNKTLMTPVTIRHRLLDDQARRSLCQHIFINKEVKMKETQEGTVVFSHPSVKKVSGQWWKRGRKEKVGFVSRIWVLFLLL